MKSGLTNRIFVFLLSLSPCFVMIHPHFINGLLFFLSFFSICMIFTKKANAAYFFDSLDKIYREAVLLFYLVPIIAILIAQFLRFDFSGPNFDSPSRILLCLPVFVMIYCSDVGEIIYLQYSIMLGLVIAWLLIKCGFSPDRGDGRVSTSFVDLLTFGSLSLTFGVLSLITIGTFPQKISWRSVVALLAFVLGMYLSVGSGSRTGWLALPIVICFWIFIVSKKNYKLLLLGYTVVAALLVVTYFSVPTINQRFQQAFSDIQSYKWNGPNAETSLSERISFYRIGFSLFVQRPLSGWGDQSFARTIKEQGMYSFASQSTRDGVIHCGFHNEIVTNAIRSGVLGIISSLILFAVPGMIFVRAFFSKDDLICKYGFYGLSYLICILVSSLSTEIFNLKYTASFHALMLSMLMGLTLAKMKKHDETCVS